MTKLPLQICTAVLALIPIVTGVVTLLGIKDPLYRPLGLPEAPILDSNLRFFGGIWLGVGLAMLWLVPSIEYQGTLFRALWVAVFLGGVGRLLSWMLIGAPPKSFMGFTLLELVGRRSSASVRQLRRRPFVCCGLVPATEAGFVRQRERQNCQRAKAR